MLPDRGVVLGDRDEGPVDVGAEVFQERLRDRESESPSAGLKRNVLGPPHIAALWAVVEIIIGAGRKILRDVGGHGGRVLVKLGDVLQVRTGETQNRTVEGDTCRLY